MTASITIVYDAKCKDCIFIKRYSNGKVNRYKCTNVESTNYGCNVSKRDLACNKWKLLND